jgi:putative membrane protein insertion efficiency factor
MTAKKSLSLRAISWYQRTVSPLFPARCKYYPSCSRYTAIAIQRFGAFRGILLGSLRLLRCQPWVDGGVDDVPEKFSLFYRFAWSSAHTEPQTAPIIALGRHAATDFSSVDISHIDNSHQEFAR